MFALIDIDDVAIKGVSHKIAHLEQLTGLSQHDRTLVTDHYEYHGTNQQIYYVPDCAAFVAMHDNKTNRFTIRPFSNYEEMQMTMENELTPEVEYAAMCGETLWITFEARHGDKLHY